MRLLLDEDSPIQLVEVLRHVLRHHDIDHVSELGWKSKKDRSVFADARQRGYDVVITNDHRQLEDPDECDAIKKSGVHHVRYAHRRKGREGLGLALGSVVAAMPFVAAALEQEGGQRLVRITGIAPHDRFHMTDPVTDPPSPYWR